MLVPPEIYDHQLLLGSQNGPEILACFSKQLAFMFAELFHISQSPKWLLSHLPFHLLVWKQSTPCYCTTLAPLPVCIFPGASEESFFLSSWPFSHLCPRICLFLPFKHLTGTLLVVQWIGMQVTWVWSLVWEDSTCCWEKQFLGRLMRSPGVPKERGVWNSQGGRKDKLFFPLHSLGLYNNNVSCLRTVFGKNLLAKSCYLKM